jgi:CrcB protein
MERMLWIGLAGALGTWLRWVVGLAATRLLGEGAPPYGTWLVNVVGCFLLGAVVEATASGWSLSSTARSAVTVGFLGGLTTYSSFNQEATSLVQHGATRTGLVYVVATALGCALAGVLGSVVTRRLA